MTNFYHYSFSKMNQQKFDKLFIEKTILIFQATFYTYLRFLQTYFNLHIKIKIESLKIFLNFNSKTLMLNKLNNFIKTFCEIYDADHFLKLGKT